MRKLLSILALSISFYCTSQDISKYRSMTEEQALTFSNQISTEKRGDWKLYTTKNTDKVLIHYFIPKETSETQIKEIENVGLSTSGIENFRVLYEAFYEGRDLDMEITGVKKYMFLSVKLKFLDAFPIWEKHFLNGTTIENIKNYNDRTRRIDSLKWLYKIKPEHEKPYWTILKFY